MAKKTWHHAFFARHIERFHRADWPESGSGFWTDWQRMLVKAGVSELEAAEASEWLFDEGDAPQWVSDHPKALMARVKACWTEKRQATAAVHVPDQVITDTTDWNAAEAKWQAMSGPEQDRWFELVLRKRPYLPELLAGDKPVFWHRVVVATAIAWAYDPQSVPADREPEVRERLPKGVSKVF